MTSRLVRPTATAAVLAFAATALLLVACGDSNDAEAEADASASPVDGSTTPPSTPATDAGRDGSAPPEAGPVATYAVGGRVAGLVGGGLVLKNNGGDDLPVAAGAAADGGADAAVADKTFVFATELASGAVYAVTVGTQPSSPSQTCTVAGASGAVASADVASVVVTCATDTFTVGGSVTGLTGAGLVLTNSGGDDLAVNAAGAFTFAGRVASGSAYDVKVKTQPAGEACTVSMGTGTVSSANVTTVSVACVPAYAIGGSVAGLAAGKSVGLSLNGGAAFTVSANGAFVLPEQLASGAAYAVTVSAQPDGQRCAVTRGAGNVANAPVSDVSVTCCADAAGGALVAENGTNQSTFYCYAAADTVQQRAQKACESHFGAGQCCVITGGYQGQQYGYCPDGVQAGGGAGTIHWHWDNHPDGHCGPNYVVGDVVAPGWCGSVSGNFLD